MNFSEPKIESSSTDFFLVLRNKLCTGLHYFVILTVIGFTLLFYYTSTPQTFSAVKRLNFQILILAVILQGLDIVLGGWRNHILLRKYKPGVSFLLCLKAQLANEFASAVTPGQGGGGPAWLYILYRGGISVATAVAVSVTVFLSTLTIFQITAASSFFILDDRFSKLHDSLYLFQIGFVTCIALTVFIVLSLCMPDRISRFIRILTRTSKPVRKKWRQHLAQLGERAAEAIHHYHSTCKLFLRKHKMAVLQSFLITALYYLVKLNLAYVLLIGLGVRADYITALALLALLRYILYFIPTPGASGIGEISIASLMSGVMPLYLLPLYTVLYRSFHLFIPAALGAWVLLRELRAARVQRTLFKDQLIEEEQKQAVNLSLLS